MSRKENSRDLIAPADDPVEIKEIGGTQVYYVKVHGNRQNVLAPMPAIHPIVAANLQSRDRQVIGRDGKPSRMLTAAEVAENEPKPEQPSDCVLQELLNNRCSPIDIRIESCKWLRGVKEETRQIRRKSRNPGPYPPQRGCFGER